MSKTFDEQLDTVFEETLKAIDDNIVFVQAFRKLAKAKDIGQVRRIANKTLKKLHYET